MNQHIINALKEYDFTFDKANGYGHIAGYEVNVIYALTTQNGPLFFFSTFLSSEKKKVFAAKINEAKIPLVKVVDCDYGVGVLMGVMTNGGIEKKCAKLLPIIIAALESLQAPKSDICPHSGVILDETNSRVVNVAGGGKVRFASEAIEDINSGIEKANEDFKNAPNNYLKGFFVILIGAFAGALITVILAFIGFITAFAPFISIFFGLFLYKKFGGKENAVMVIMSLVTTLVVIMGAVCLVYMSAADALAIKDGVEVASGFEALSYCIDNVKDFAGSFFGDLGLNLLVIIVAEGATIYRLIQMIKRPKAIA